VAILLDQAWTMFRGANVGYGEWAFLSLVGANVLDALIYLAYALSEPSGDSAGPWMKAPGWWDLASIMLHALFPLAMAGAVLTIVNERLALQLRTRALSDELTGALSRRGLRELGERLIHTARARSQQVAVLMLDVDHFKKINATYGHLVGDDVLRHVVYVMQERLRDDALLARYGGEEFAVLLPIRHTQEAGVVAERLKNAVEHKPAQTLAGLIDVTISVGVAFLEAGTSLEQALATADARLYDAKNQGRNCIVIDGALQPQPVVESAPEIAHT
ncbi:MAG TPA: GGDEF domain-containing protein, partial [Aquabacterium sp.]|nr:GGDEF domain-containing protein [Aquabacterium sp.]